MDRSKLRPPLRKRRTLIRRQRLTQFETLERRNLLAVAWRNPIDSLDVNQDQFVVPLDALLVINELNSAGPHALPAPKDPAADYFDSNGDQFVSPVDALLVINYLNDGAGQQRRLRETGSLASETTVLIGLGQNAGSRTYRVKLESTFDTTDQGPALEDLLAVYLVDEQNPAATILDRGTPGTAFFTLAGSEAEYIPGRVRWDGSILEIDLTEFETKPAGILKFQLLSNDADSATQVTIKPLSNDVDVAGQASPTFGTPAPPQSSGGPLGLSGLAATTQVDVNIHNVRLDSTTGKFSAEMVLDNTGADLGSRMAVAFLGLPAGVSLLNASGTTAGGAPYLNVQDAVGDGGLRAGQASTAIRLEYSDPGLTRFSITPQILAGINHAPTLDAVGPLTISPGDVRRVPLVANDSDGDSITFALRNADSLPTTILRANGSLEFRPEPDQLGSYSFQVVASDGALEAVRQVTLNVIADPLTTTRLNGQVLRVDGTPLSGITVEVGSVQALTLADGSFLLDFGAGPVVSDTIKIRGELIPGPQAYPFIAEKIDFILSHDLFPNVNNAIDRPIYLPILDPRAAQLSQSRGLGAGDSDGPVVDQSRHRRVRRCGRHAGQRGRQNDRYDFRWRPQQQLARAGAATPAPTRRP